ncbi:MAG: chaperonin GroEL, partial [Candidatus Parvarchaeota archaeon]|nr:chaperonin GroEL [Candidatus Rehaiarchaeum fermentans]
QQKELQHRVEDAVNATKAAVEEGIVPGGGVAFIRTLPALENLIDELSKKDIAEYVGALIVKRAIESPLKQIAYNAGLDPAVVLEKVKEGKDNFGFNAMTLQYEDLMKSGIIDPTKVTITALKNAGSVASLLLITESVVGELPEDKKKEHEHYPEDEY